MLASSTSLKAYTQAFQISLHKIIEHLDDEIFKGRCILIEDIVSPVCDYAGNVDLKKVLLKSKKKTGGNHAFFKDSS